MKNTIKLEISKQLKKTVALCVMSSVCMASVFSVGAFSRKVYVNVGREEISSWTMNNDTYKILDQVGVKVSDKDVVERKDDDAIRLSVKKSVDFSVSKGSEKVSLEKPVSTVKEAIEVSGIALNENDITNYSKDEAVFSGMNIEITENAKIKIFVDGDQKEYSVSSGKTVSDTLESLKILLSSNDLINADLSSNVYDGMEIIINRVEFREVVKTEEIPFKTVAKTTHLLDGKPQQVSSTGKKGERKVTLKETVVDGNVTESQEISSEIISEPEDEIVLQGTDYVSKKVNKESNSKFTETSTATKVLTGSATAYTASKNAKTSTGSTPKQGVTLAVNPNIIPYGSNVVITDTNDSVIWKGKAEDTGSALKRGRALVDIYMNSESDCLRFGRKKVKVYVS